MTPNRERVMVGAFVVVAAAVLSVTTVAVWGGMRRSGVPHRMYLKFSGGVQPGTAVRYGGLRVGSVQSVRVDPGDSTRIEINLIVDRDAPVKTDSVARLSSLGLLSDYYIEISTGTAGAALASAGAVLQSAEATGLAQLGDSIQDVVPQIHQALDKLTLNLDSLQTTVTRANDLLNDSNRATVGQALARANDLLNDRNRANIAESLNNFNQLLAETRPKLSTGLDNINEATARLTPLLEDVRKTSARADQTLATLDSMLNENRPDLRASLSELREVLASSKLAVDQLQGIMSQNAINIYEILDNLRASSTNVRSLTETIKSNPTTLIRGVNVRDLRPGGGMQK